MYNELLVELMEVLYDLDCPAITVNPGINPPPISPENAILRIGSSVLMQSFTLKKEDSERISAFLIEPAF